MAKNPDDTRLGPEDYTNNGNIRTYPGDVLQAMSGNSHANTVRENAKARQGIKMDPTDDAHETTHRAPGDE